MNTAKFLKILVCRVDRLGDFCHSLPALSLLRRSLPDCQIDLLVSNKNYSLTRSFNFYDNVISFEDSTISDIATALYTHALVLNEYPDAAGILKAAKVPCIFGQRRGVAQWKYSHSVRLFRSKCIKAEWRYCIDHVEHFLSFLNVKPHDLIQRDWDFSHLRDPPGSRFTLAPETLLIFIHPGSGGSEPGLTVDMFASLAKKINDGCKLELKFIITGTPKEKPLMHDLMHHLDKMGLKNQLLPFQEDLSEFLISLSAADVFISGSTGPLHLASLHNPITVGFYTERKRNLKVRWASLSDARKRLSFAPPPGKETGDDMSCINLQEVALQLNKLIEKYYDN